jgi:hypothetical protein
MNALVGRQEASTEQMQRKNDVRLMQEALRAEDQACGCQRQPSLKGFQPLLSGAGIPRGAGTLSSVIAAISGKREIKLKPALLDPSSVDDMLVQIKDVVHYAQNTRACRTFME